MVVSVEGEVLDEQPDAVLLGVGVHDGHVHVLRTRGTNATNAI